MAKPQIERGYTPIANELLEVILRARFQYQELKILLAIARMTYGWSKKEAQISYGALARAIMYHRNNVVASCLRLERDKVLKIGRGGGKFQTNVVSINKNYEEWLNRELVDNSLGVLCPDMAGMPCVDIAGVPSRGAMPTHSMGAMPTHSPLNQPKTNGLKQAVKQGSRPVENLKNQKQNLSNLLKGKEKAITGPDPREIVNALSLEGFDIGKIWGAIVQSRKKNNPAGYLVSILGDPKFQISDSAMEQAKKEMRHYDY